MIMFIIIREEKIKRIIKLKDGEGHPFVMHFFCRIAQNNVKIGKEGRQCM
jgi:hypothetical protein